MKYEAEYEVDSAMQDASLRQSLVAIHLAPKFPMLLLLVILAVCVVFTGTLLNPFVRWLLPVVCVIIALTWFRAYREAISIGRKRLSLSERPITRISFDDREISSQNANEKKIYEWRKLERVIETRDFLFIMAGKMSLFCIPKRVINSEVEAYIKEKIKKGA